MSVASRLVPIVDDVRRRLAERRSALPAARLAERVQPDPARRARFLSALSSSGLALIAECKRRSPSAGALTRGEREVDWRARAAAYAAGGAAALSVLTEQDHFGGQLEHLCEARAGGLPCLRKDFVVDESMLDEACLFGADAVLLLPCVLADEELARLFARASELGLAALVEVHDEGELARALALEPDLVGVNARDLETFTVDLAVVERLLPQVPTGVLRVAESGVHGIRELLRVRAAGADAALVGEALMRSDDPTATLTAWRARLDG